jgi:hypothetical protein
MLGPFERRPAPGDDHFACAPIAARGQTVLRVKAAAPLHACESCTAPARTYLAPIGWACERCALIERTYQKLHS